MAAKTKLTGKALSMGAGVALGLTVSMTVTLAGSAVTAWLILSEKAGESAAGYGAMLILVLASALGALFACAAIQRRRLMVCGICAGGYYLLLLAMTALFFGGQYQGMGVTALMVLLGGGIAVIPGLTGKRSGVRRRKFSAYR